MTAFSRSLILAAVAVLALGACTSDYPGHALSPQDLHPLKVSQTAMTLALDLPVAGSQIAGEDAARFDRFVDDYLSLGAGPLEFIASEREPPGGRLKLLTERAMRRGVSGRDIKVRLASFGAGQPQPVVLSYRRYLVELPKCGNWDHSPSFNPANTTGANFGCANQRNIGNMVANPGDLQQPAPSGSISAAWTDRVIGLYNQGKKTEAEDSRSNKASVSTVGGQ